jgi:glutamine synthetase
MKWCAVSLVAALLVAPTFAFAPAVVRDGRRAVASATSTTLHVNLLERTTGESQLDPIVIDRFNALPFPKDKVLAEYVWVDAAGNTRSKTRTLAAAKV